MHRWRTIARAAVVISLVMASGCTRTDARTPGHPRLIVALGAEGSVSQTLGAALASAYEARVPNLRIGTVHAAGVDESLEALRGSSADLGFVDAEGAYIGYRQERLGSPARHVRAIAMLYPTAVQIFVRRSANVHAIQQLRGRTVVVGDRDGYADRAMRQVLQGYGLTAGDITPVFASGAAALTPLRAGAVDAIVFYTPYRSQGVMAAVEAADLALLPLDRARIAEMQTASERNHFLKTITIPAGTYPHQKHDVVTMGDEILLLCGADLDEALVYSLTRALFEAAPALVAAHPAAASINPERGPTTSVPLHPGAARYYRERELPR